MPVVQCRKTKNISLVRVNAKGKKKLILIRPCYRFATDGKFTAGLWHDRRDVTFLSTIHSASIEFIDMRPKGGRHLESTPCPTAIVECNKFKNAVDLADQLLSTTL